MQPIVFGLAGQTLSSEERAFFKEADPLGFILFARNIETPDQTRALIAALREAVDREDAPIFIDQEGGRVARLKPPHWLALPPQRALGSLYAQNKERGREAVRLHARLIAHALYDLGIIGNFAPVCDLAIPGAAVGIGDRAFAADVDVVTDCARVACETYLENGVLPCLKHLPGHGRMEVDPHFSLPLVTTPLALLEKQDFVPFARLAHFPAGMTSHGVFTAIDPTLPASLSPRLHADIIRGHIGFQGLLFTDDLAMKALSDDVAGNAAKALAAGSDIALYCSGEMGPMLEMAAKIGEIGPKALQKIETALALVRAPTAPYDPAPDFNRLAALLAVTSP